MPKVLFKYVVLFALLLSVAVILRPSHIGGSTAARLRASCANNMKALGLALQHYAYENPDQLFPLLSSEPGRLMWSPPIASAIVPEPSIYICPSDPDRKEKVRKDKNAPNGYRASPDFSAEEILSDPSYLYFGYALFDDHDVEVFAKEYKARIATGRLMSSDIPLPVRKTLAAVGSDERDQNSNASPPTAIPLFYNTLHRLTSDVAELVLPADAVGNEHEAKSLGYLKSIIPVLIERLGNHIPGGSLVLYLDGHVEFIRYPGRWPMTEKTIGLLNELDALGDNP